MAEIKQTLKQFLIDNNLKGQKILLAVSGGLDSCVLLHSLNNQKKNFQLQLVVAHVHHGHGENLAYRNQAQSFVQQLAQKLELPFVTNNIPEHTLLNENELRNFRYETLLQFMQQQNCAFIALAHHQDDLLETRLMRLIRGTGVEGLESMKAQRHCYLRPFLDVPLKQLIQYAQEHHVDYLSDPSNDDTSIFRNWLREKWLPMVEDYRPGALGSLARSLQTILQTSQKDEDFFNSVITDQGILRVELARLSRSDQRRVFLHFLRQNHVKNYTLSQVDEVLKRLDSSQKQLTFNVLGCCWKVDTQHISFAPLKD